MIPSGVRFQRSILIEEDSLVSNMLIDEQQALIVRRHDKTLIQLTERTNVWRQRSQRKPHERIFELSLVAGVECSAAIVGAARSCGRDARDPLRRAECGREAFCPFVRCRNACDNLDRRLLRCDSRRRIAFRYGRCLPSSDPREPHSRWPFILYRHTREIDRGLFAATSRPLDSLCC